MTAYTDFETYMAQINDLCTIINLLNWDARTQMPPGGARTRANQLATLSQIAQTRFTGDETARLIDAAEAELAGEDENSYQVRAVRQARSAYEIARRIPLELVSTLAAFKPVAEQVWFEAKTKNDFALFRPYLEQMRDLNQQVAEAIGYEDHPYDALLLKYEPSMTAARLQALFDSLKAGLQPLLRRIIADGTPVRADFFDRDWPEEKQRAFALEIAQAFGYDLNRGRLDQAPHPFEISFTRDDVRITTRYNRRYAPAAIFGAFHETGHALYEQGIDPALSRGVLTTDLLDLYAVGGTSYGAHESQSRLWENQVGRSRIFWQRHFSRLRDYFPEQLAGVDAETFYRAVNRVRPTFIRVEADEVTYNFHIMLRAEIEMGLLDGTLTVKDLPEIWNAKMQAYLGITPPDDTRGVLQDTHWSSGWVGSFPSYTVGNVMSAQFFAAAREQVAGLDKALARGDYAPLLAWLTDNIYRHGRTFSAEELLVRATGSPLTVEPYLAYLREKYNDLFPESGRPEA